MAAPAEHNLFYAPPDRISEDLVRFDRDESSHIVTSLRKAAGEAITMTDGAGRLYRARIEEAGKRGVVARIESVEDVPPPLAQVTLFQGMIRPQKMDMVIEKCVELGAGAIVPVVTERAMQRDPGARLERWSRIAVEAMKQSLRAYRPEISPALTFDRALGMCRDCDLVLVAHEQETAHPLEANLVMGKRSIGLFIGPEGGFSDTEIEALGEGGAGVFGLGPARLRSETAAIAGVALIERFLQGAARGRDC